jgi:hypothetical protein
MIWAGGDGGLSRFDPATRTFTSYSTETSGLSSSVITHIYEDPEGTLWVGTNSGLNRFDPQTGTFQVLTAKQGLSGNQIGGMISDARNHLWITTNKGLSRYDPVNRSFRNYDKRDGLQSDQFLLHAIYRTRDNCILAGGIHGFNCFVPGNLVDNPYIPPVVLTDFQIFTRSVSIGPESPLQQAIYAARKVRLSYRDSVISFRFAALNFRAPLKNRYAYKLEGFDKEWTQTDSRFRMATYTNLDPGTYTFRVMGSNNDGVWNRTGVSLSVTIVPPWWKTWWFRCLAGLAAAGLALAVYTFRVRIVRRRTRELEAQGMERTRQLTLSNKALI